jgi:hypothetical protein
VPMDPEDEAEMADDTAAVGESDRPTPPAAVPATEPAADPVALTEMQQQTDGAPPTATTPIEEAPMSGTNTGAVPGAAGTAEGTSTVPTAVAEAQRAQAAAEQQLAEANRRTAEAEQRLARLSAVEAARPIASTLLGETQLPAAAQARVLAQVTAQVPMTEAMALDETAFRTAVTTAAPAKAASPGSATPRPRRTPRSSRPTWPRASCASACPRAPRRSRQEGGADVREHGLQVVEDSAADLLRPRHPGIG